jgi:hypothetical protein
VTVAGRRFKTTGRTPIARRELRFSASYPASRDPVDLRPVENLLELLS